MILTFVLAASFPFQLRKIGIERNVLLHCKSIILVLNFASQATARTDKQTNKQIPRTSPRKVSSIARSLKTKTRNQNVKM
jgi:hypothetical protein